MTHSIPADVIKEVGRLIRKGERNKEIAECLGLHPQRVSHYRIMMGAGSPSSILAPKIIADVYKMGNISEVARKWGCTRQHVYNLLHREENKNERD